MVKHLICYTILCLIIGVCGATQKASAVQPPLIPLENFFRNPDKVAYELSPDGEYLAYLAPWSNRLNIFIQKVGEKETIWERYL